ncbi:MAG: AMP-binding protein [Caldilineaceae bacterium]|nr:AMP-binding protein [Caldilineaceae bacterium]
MRTLTTDMSLFHCFAAVLATTLYKISPKERLAIGVPFQNRATSSFKETIGLFIHIYPMLVHFEADDTFRSLLQRNLKESFTALRHAQYSADELGKSFDVVLNYLTASFGDFAGFRAENRWVHTGYGDSNHLLRLQVEASGGIDNIILHFDLNSDVFDIRRQQWIVRHFLNVLDSFLITPDQPIRTLSLLSSSERQQLLLDFNQTGTPELGDMTVVQLFEQQVANSPEAMAIISGAQSLTYAALNQRANQLAHHLAANGIKEDKVVALALQRSPEVLVALLGVLKAGGVYLPLDRTLPPGRLAFMLDETEATTVITSKQFAEALPQSDARIVCLDGEWEALAGEPTTNPVTDVAPESPAYIIYTSGSTGTPKGALISHRNLLNYATWAKDFYLRGEKLAFPLFTSLSFDLTVTSIFVPLISGGSIVVYPENDLGNLSILDVLAENRVDIIKLTPAHLALIKETNTAQSRLRK